MSHSRFLMCAPEYYEVAYEINPWMSVRKKVSQDQAMKQWQAYYDLLTGKLGMKVDLIEPVKGLPDMVFTANAGLVSKRTFIRSNFRFKERRGEEPYFEKYFRDHGYVIKTIVPPFCFEGEGDALSMNRELYTGYHFRSDLEAHDLLSEYVHSTYFALELCDDRFYHLDTCFAPLNDRTALIFFEAFAPYAQLTLWETVPDPIAVPENEALQFACNAVVCGNSIILPEGCPKTTAELEKRGYDVYALDFSEFIKAGGAAKCLVLNLN